MALLLIAAGTITCSDATTRPATPPVETPSGLNAATVTLAPELSPDAARAYAALKGSDLGVRTAYLRLSGQGVATRDTIVALSPGQEPVSVDVRILMPGVEQILSAFVELRAVDGTPLFSGTQDVTVHASGQTSVAPRAVKIEYVGPGRTAATVSISPTAVTLSGAGVRQLAASAKDAASTPLTDVLVQWTSSDTTVATVIHTGRATSTATATGKRGSATITASTPLGIAGRVQFDVVPQPAKVVLVGGDAQSGAAGTKLPQLLLVEVRATDGLPLAGVAVAFRAVTGGGSVAAASVISDSNGRASTQMTLGNAAGSHAFEASVAGIPPVAVTQIATKDPVVIPRVVTRMVKVAGDGQQATTGTGVRTPPTVMVTDDAGQPVVGAPVFFTVTSGAGSTTLHETSADAGGLARAGSWTLGAAAGPNTLVATSGTASATFTATGTVGSVSTIRVMAAPDSLVVGTVANFTFGIVDANGNPIAQQGVVTSLSYTFQGTSRGGGTLTTDSQGRAYYSISPVAMPAGPCTFVLTAPGLAPLTFAIPVVAGAPAYLIQQGLQYVRSGMRFPKPPVAQTVDIVLNPTNSPGLVVTASLVAGNGTLGGTTTVTTDARGAATFSDLTLTGPAGPHSLLLSTPTLPNSVAMQHIVYAGVPTNMAISAGANQSAAVGSAVAVAPAVRITDAAGNPVSGREITFTVGASGGQVSNASSTSSSVKVVTDGVGSAQLTSWTLGATAGVSTVVATADTTLVGSPATFTATALLAARMRFVTPPSSSVMSAVRMAQQPRVALVDANGAAMTTAGVTITASVTSGIGNVRNATAITDASGVASFTELTLSSGNPGSFTLSFSSPGYATLDFQPVTVSAFAGSLSIVAGNNQSAVAGTNVAIAPAVLVKGAGGNSVPGVLVQFVIPFSQGVVSADGTSSTAAVVTTTDAQGIARLTSWTMGHEAGYPNVVNAIVYSVANGHVAFTGTSLPGPATGLRISIVPTSGVNGTPFTPAPSVFLADRYGNRAPQTNVAVSAMPLSGSYSNATALTDTSGFATFATLTVSALVGDNALRFIAPGLSFVDSPPITMSAGPPFFLRIAAGAGQTATAGTPVLVAPEVRVEDYAGNGLPGIVVAFNSVTAGATMETAAGIQQPATLTTDANGKASLRSWTLSSTPGTNTIWVSVPSLPLLPSGPVTFNATGLAPSGNVLAMLVAPTSATSGAPIVMPPTVQLRNASAAPVMQAGVPVTASLVSGGGVLTGTTTVTTNAAGVATFGNLILTGAKGSYSIRFSSPGTLPVVLTLTM